MSEIGMPKHTFPGHGFSTSKRFQTRHDDVIRGSK
jgi:hypothetical protein